MKTTVFICTYNRGNLIDGNLKFIIKHQTLKPNEIIDKNIFKCDAFYIDRKWPAHN